MKKAADMKNKSLASLTEQIIVIRSQAAQSPESAENGGFIPDSVIAWNGSDNTETFVENRFDYPFVSGDMSPIAKSALIEKSDVVPMIYKAGGNSGAMIALFLSSAIGSKFVQDDPNALPLGELHLTLAYLGKADKLTNQQKVKAHHVIKMIAGIYPALKGAINGLGRFCNGDDDGDPFFIIPDLALLPDLRHDLIKGLKEIADIESANDHGFTPHITLTYLPHAEYIPFEIIEKTPIIFPAISLVLGNDRFDYPFASDDMSPIAKSALIERIGARHTGAECGVIQKMHDLSIELGADCHRIVRKAGARHSHADQSMVQRIHDDCVGLGASCPVKGEQGERDLYHSQVMKEAEIIKAQSDAPNYAPASTPQRCKNCRFFLGDPGRDWCELFDFTADQDYVCDAWEAQRPDEIPGYVANKAELARIAEEIMILRGGPTSGNWGHGGRPGKRGGSGRGGGFKRIGVKDGKAGRGKIKQASRRTRVKDERKKQSKKKGDGNDKKYSVKSSVKNTKEMLTFQKSAKKTLKDGKGVDVGAVMIGWKIGPGKFDNNVIVNPSGTKKVKILEDVPGSGGRLFKIDFNGKTHNNFPAKNLATAILKESWDVGTE
jgi:2'-5' RNA ligase